MATNGRNLSKITKNMNAFGEFTSEAFSDTLLAASGPVLYDSDADVPIDGVALGSQAFVPSEGYLVRLTDEAWWVVNETPPPPWDYGGVISAYFTGSTTSSSNYHLKINAVSFTSDGNAQNPANLVSGIVYAAGASSMTHGYTIGIDDLNASEIVKMPFANLSANNDVGGLYEKIIDPSTQGSETDGYISGGGIPQVTQYTSSIRKLSYATDTGSDTGSNLTTSHYGSSGASSVTYGYVHGGVASSPGSEHQVVLDKFSFANNATVTNVGILSAAYHWGVTSGHSSNTHGYASGGASPDAGSWNVIQKYPFTSDANSVHVGFLTKSTTYATGASSLDYGYVAGGFFPGASYMTDAIEKFAFVTDANATDVGNLIYGARHMASSQV
jgi:hypothetical protein